MKSKYYFDHLDKAIQEKMFEHQVKQGNKRRDPDVFRNFISIGRKRGGFTWSDTQEGHTFWSNVLGGYTTVRFNKSGTMHLCYIESLARSHKIFYEKYPELKESSLNGDDFEPEDIEYMV